MNQVKCCWGLNILPQSTTYLGVPLFLSKCKSQDFRYVKERLDGKLNGWKSKNLSWSGRATLIRSVAQAILAYSISATLLLKGLYDQLDGSILDFGGAPKSIPDFGDPKFMSALRCIYGELLPIFSYQRGCCKAKFATVPSHHTKQNQEV
ncbi:hypothetical protein CMV_000124 [Castanea mollissima]|uniref:Uncharacterized protein n=1 Tax=Castanea mollissima TaxID=60419 RepID=A0A8J4S5Q5_9ROSI|nr:hypothetical protein CMV_000124 [Castanea mollissima]